MTERVFRSLAGLLSLMIWPNVATCEKASLEHAKRAEISVVLFASQMPDTQVLLLEQTIAAHLKGLPTRLEVSESAAPTPGPAARSENSIAESVDRTGDYALWFTGSGKEVHTLAPELNGEAFSTIPIKEEPGSSPWAETIAVLVLSDVQALLPEPPMPRAVAPEEAASIDTAGAPPATPSTKRVQASQAVGLDAPPHVWLGPTLGYAPTWLTDTAEPTHGAVLGLSTGYRDRLTATLSAQYLPPLQLEVGGQEVRFRQWPFYLIARWYAQFGAFNLGAGMGAVVSLSTLSGLDTMPMHRQSVQTQVNIGAAARVTVRYWATEGFAIFLDGGADFYRDRVQYTFADQTVLKLNRIKPLLTIGAMARFELSRG